MTALAHSIMRFFLHPLQSMATALRSWSTGLSPEKLAEYDSDLLEIVKKGQIKLYRSADQAVNDILGKSVRPTLSSKG